MATTREQAQQAADEFGAAYGEDAPAKTAQTDDDAFGLNLDAVVDTNDGIPERPEDATEVLDPEAATAPAGEAAEPAATDTPSEPAMTAEDIARAEQRLKSWEGRLKAREAEQRAGAGGEGAAEAPAEEAGEKPVEQIAEAEAAKLQGMDPDEALKRLSADFGDEFTNLLNSIIDAKVNKALHGMNSSVDEIINSIQDDKARLHFETVVDRHPDFNDIAESEDFKAYVEALPDDAKAKAERVIDSGSAWEINRLLDAFKAQQKPAAAPAPEPEPAAAAATPEDDPSMDAAEGVRSSGMRLPTQPGASSDYAAAWDEFKD